MQSCSHHLVQLIDINIVPQCMQDNCNIFVNNIAQLNTVVEKYISSIDQQASSDLGQEKG